MPLAKELFTTLTRRKIVVEKKCRFWKTLSWVIENKVLELYLMSWSWTGYQDMKRFIVLYYVFYMNGGLCKVREHVNYLLSFIWEWTTYMDLVAPLSNSRGCFKHVSTPFNGDVQVSSYISRKCTDRQENLLHLSYTSMFIRLITIFEALFEVQKWLLLIAWETRERKCRWGHSSMWCLICFPVVSVYVLYVSLH